MVLQKTVNVLLLCNVGTSALAPHASFCMHGYHIFILYHVSVISYNIHIVAMMSAAELGTCNNIRDSHLSKHARYLALFIQNDRQISTD